MDNKIKYSFYDLIELRYADPINSITLGKDILIAGTMMGRTFFYCFSSKYQRQLTDLSNEAITSTSIDTNHNDSLYFSIGDEEVCEFLNEKGNNDYPESTRYKNYTNEEMHNNRCESCYTMLDKNKYLMLFFDEPYNANSPIMSYYCDFLIYSYDNERNKIEGKINLSNYVVPFEYTDNKFIFLEHLTEGKRKLSIFDFVTKTKTENEIAVGLGHVSFLRLVHNNFLIVRNYNIISVFDEKMKEICNLSYTKGEIESIDWYEDDSKKIILVVLDSSGNVTEYSIKDNKMEQIGELCLNKVIEIDLEMKQKGLFDMEFPYYVKANAKFIVITCDYACIIIKKI